MTAPCDYQQKHELLAAIALEQNCSESSLLEGGGSIHKFPSTTSFSNVDVLAAATDSRSYIGTSGEDLVFSAHLAPEDTEAVDESRPKKRRRGNNTESESALYARKIEASRARIEKSVSELPSADLNVGQSVLTKLVNELRGPAGEIVVQSIAIMAKKLAVEDTRQRVVLAARLNAGIALRVDVLRRCMGACWTDGLLTTTTTLHGIGKVELPFSEEANLSSFFGNAAILLVTSVPIN